MRLRPILHLWRKDFRESFRDRKTLFLSLLLPVLLYPLLIIGGLQLAVMQVEEIESRTTRVFWVGVDPDEPLAALLREPHASALRMESTWGGSVDEGLAALRQREVDVVVEASPVPRPGEERQESVPTERADEDVLPPPIPGPWTRADADAGYPERAFKLLYLSVVERSSSGVGSVEELLREDARARIRARVLHAELPESFARPLAVERSDLSERRERGGMLLAALLPLLLLISILSGALYPAIDLTAGERERGTIQTLFTAPVSSEEILASKFLAVLSVALVTGVANLVSLALVLAQGAAMVGEAWDEVEVGFGPGEILLLCLVVVQLALFASATLIGAAALAKSTKEAQLYTMPVYLLCLLPAAWAQMPTVSLSSATVLIPGANVVLLLREALVHGVHPWDALLVTAANAGFAAAAVLLSARIFSREGLVVSEASPFRLLASRAHLRPSLKPGAGEALAFVALLFVAFFYVGSWLQAAHPILGLIATLWLVLLLPTVAATWWWKLDWRTTFAWRASPWSAWVGAGLLGLSLWVPVAFLSGMMESWTGPIPEEALEEFAELLARPETLAGALLLIFAVSVSPAVCEELLFRGFLLQGLRGKERLWGAIVLSALLFGVFHLMLPRVLTTTVLGLFLGWVVLRSGGIGPAILLHALNNGAALALAWSFPELETDAMPWGWALPAAGVSVVVGLFLVARTHFDHAACDARLEAELEASEPATPAR